MLKLLMKFVMNLITTIANIVLAPVTALLGAINPDLASAVSNIGTYLQVGLENVSWFLSFLGVPEACTTLFFTYMLTKFTFWIGYRSVKFVLKTYNYFKP